MKNTLREEAKIHYHYAMDLAHWLGYLTQHEVMALHTIARGIMKDHPVIVNIGVGAGTSSLAMAESNRDARMISVDISPGGPLGGLESERNAFIGANLFPPFQILADSKELPKSWKKDNYKVDKIDLLFIDGDHTYPGIRGDIEAWLPLVAEGGWILFHDYGSPDWPNVKQVVDMYDGKEFEVILVVDTVAIARNYSG